MKGLFSSSHPVGLFLLTLLDSYVFLTSYVLNYGVSVSILDALVSNILTLFTPEHLQTQSKHDLALFHINGTITVVLAGRMPEVGTGKWSKNGVT